MAAINLDDGHYFLPVLRPKTRGDCHDGPRPCPWISCRQHLLTELTENARLVFHTGCRGCRPTVDEIVAILDQMKESCALDVAERGGVTLEEIAEMMQLSLERIRQVEADGIRKSKDAYKSGKADALMDKRYCHKCRPRDEEEGADEAEADPVTVTVLWLD